MTHIKKSSFLLARDPCTESFDAKFLNQFYSWATVKHPFWEMYLAVTQVWLNSCQSIMEV